MEMLSSPNVHKCSRNEPSLMLASEKAIWLFPTCSAVKADVIWLSQLSFTPGCTTRPLTLNVQPFTTSVRRTVSSSANA